MAPVTVPAKRPRGRLRRLGLWVLEAAAGLVGLAFLVLVGLGVRLEFAPIEAPWLTPLISAQLTETVRPYTVTLGAARFAWAADHRAVEIVVQDVRLCRADGPCLVDLPQGTVSLSVLSLLTGRIVPTRLDLQSPTLQVIRESDGTFAFDQKSGRVPETAGDATFGTAVPDESGFAPRALLQALSGAGGGGHPLGRLDTLVLNHVSVSVDDRVNHVVVGLDQGRITLTRQEAGLGFALAGDVRFGAAQVGVDLAVNYRKNQDSLAYRIDLFHLDPAGIAAASALVPAPFGGVHLGVNATLEGTVSLADGVAPGPTSLFFDGSGGQIVDPHLSGGKLDLRTMGGVLRYQPDQRRLLLEQFTADLGGPSVDLTAAVTPLPPLTDLLSRKAPLFVAATVQAKGISFDRLPSYWPPDLAPNPRRWIVANLSVGRIETVETTALLEMDPLKGMDLVALVGRLKARGTVIDYLHGLPKLEGVDALIDMTAGRLDFALTAGRVRGLSLQRAAVVIDDFDAPVERITIDLGLKGPAKDVMILLDSPPLRYGQAVGIDPARIAGTIDGTLHFRFPLKRTLPVGEIDYAAKATLAGFGLPNAALGRDLTDGAFAVVLDHTTVSFDGNARLDGVMSSLAFTQRLIGTAPPKIRVKAKTRLDDAALERFGLGAVGDYLKGPVGAEIAYQDDDGHQAKADIALDLTDATLAVGPIAYQKPAGLGAKAGFSVQLEDGAVATVAGITLRAPALDLAGSAKFAGGQLGRVILDRVRLGATELTGDLAKRAQNYAIKLKASTLDLEAILQGDDGAPPPDEPDAAPLPKANGPHYQVEMKAERVLLGPGRTLYDLNANLTVADGTVEQGTLIAGLGQRKAGQAGATLSFSLDAVRDGGAFSIATDDLGLLLKTANVTQSVSGGTLAITGKSRIYHKGRRFEGRIDGGNYRITEAPLIARLLALPSFSSVTSLLAGDGIPFSTLKADFALSDRKLDLINALTYGGAIGVNVTGGIDFGHELINLDGTVAPAYTVNSVLGDVPILGDLLVGGSGQGLFAAKFRVAGPLGKPLVSVNPLSALAPGFLRNLFLFDAPDPMKK